MTDVQRAPVDLDSCADEPIHIPGSIQPHGVLLAVSEPDLVVRAVSANCADLFGVDAAGLLGRPLGDAVVGGRLWSDLQGLPRSDHPAEEFSISTSLLVDGHERTVDAVLHRADELLVVEVEPEAGPPTSARTFQLTRASISRIHRSQGLDALYQVAVEEMSRLTGFDRVMVYRFDGDWNGEVVAEVRARDDLTSFLGLHYPASDIPAQARRLYRSNWLRLIVDVDYVPVPLVPQDNPLTGRPLDLSHAGLRSVSPVHLEYLRNMGVAASMSVSLLDDGELWGLIACHHYNGPHRPSYEIRAAAVFLGQTLALRLVETARRESERRLTLARSTLASLTAATLDESRPAAVSLTHAPRTLLDLVPAAGAAVSLEGIESSVGVVPSSGAVRALVARARADGVEVLALSQVPGELAGIDEITDRACGALVMSLPDDQYVVWCRPELIQTVSWAGDPRAAETPDDGGTGRINPRKSFAKWQENLRGHSEPWTSNDVELAAALRHALLDTLYDRSRRLASTAAVLQRSLLPDRLPEVTGWTMSAVYQPRAGGEVGGDWYDVVLMPDGKLVCVLGDVAGHGVGVAGSMGQLRNGLRAYVVEEDSPARLLHRLDRLAGRLLPDVFATAVVLVLDPGTGLVRLASAGHLAPCVVPHDGPARLMLLEPSPPLGAAAPGGLAPKEATQLMVPGDQLVLYSDGLVERRGEPLDDGLARLVATGTGLREPRVLCARLVADCRDPVAEDDATVLVLRRDA